VEEDKETLNALFAFGAKSVGTVAINNGLGVDGILFNTPVMSTLPF
jgi:hypothetical protein